MEKCLLLPKLETFLKWRLSSMKEYMPHYYFFAFKIGMKVWLTIRNIITISSTSLKTDFISSDS